MSDFNRYKELAKGKMGRLQLDELYRNLARLDVTQLSQSLVVLLNALLKTEQSERRATQVVLMVSYAPGGIDDSSIPSRCIGFGPEGCLCGEDLARRPGPDQTSAYKAGEFPLPEVPTPEMLEALKSPFHQSPSPQLARIPGPSSAGKARSSGEHPADRQEELVKWELQRREQEYLQAQVKDLRAQLNQNKKELEDVRRMRRQEKEELDRLRRRLNATISTADPQEEHPPPGRIASKVVMEQKESARGTMPPPTVIPQKIVRQLPPPESQPSPQGSGGSAASAATRSSGKSKARTQSTQPSKSAKISREEEDDKSPTPARMVFTGGRDAEASASVPLQISIDNSAPRDLMEDTTLVRSVIHAVRKTAQAKQNSMPWGEWTPEEQERRSSFKGLRYTSIANAPKYPPGTVHLIVGDSQVKDLCEMRTRWLVGVLSMGGASMPLVMYALTRLKRTRHIPTVTLMIGFNDVSRRRDTKLETLEENLTQLLEELRFMFTPDVLTVCTIPPFMREDKVYGENVSMPEKVEEYNQMVRRVAYNTEGVMLFDVEANLLMVDTADLSKDGIHLDSKHGITWANQLFERHAKELQEELIRRAVFTVNPMNPPPKIKETGEFQGLDLSRRTSLQSGTLDPITPVSVTSGTSFPETRTPTEYSNADQTAQSCVKEEHRREDGTRLTPSAELGTELAKLSLADLPLMRELEEALGCPITPEILGRHHCIDWLEACEMEFSRGKNLALANLDASPALTVYGPISLHGLLNVREWQEVEPVSRKGKFLEAPIAKPKHLKALQLLTNPFKLDTSLTAYPGKDWCAPTEAVPTVETQLSRYTMEDFRGARTVIIADSDYDKTSPSLFWPDTLFFCLPGATWEQMLTMVSILKQVLGCNPDLILYAGVTDQIYATGHLQSLSGDGVDPAAVLTTIKLLVSTIMDIEGQTKARLGEDTKVVFISNPGFVGWSPAMQLVVAWTSLALQRSHEFLLVACNRPNEPGYARTPACWSDISHALRGIPGMENRLIVLDEVLGLEISNLARIFRFNHRVKDDSKEIVTLSNDLWFRHDEIGQRGTDGEQRPYCRRKNEMRSEKLLRKTSERTTARAGHGDRMTKEDDLERSWPHISPRLVLTPESEMKNRPRLIRRIEEWIKARIFQAVTEGRTIKELMQQVNGMTLLRYFKECPKEHGYGEDCERFLQGLSPCWTLQYLVGVYTDTKDHRVAHFLQAVKLMPVNLIYALYVTYGAELFVRGPAVLFTKGIEILRVDGLLTLILLTHGELQPLHTVLNLMDTLAKDRDQSPSDGETASSMKLTDTRYLLMQYLMRQNRADTGEDEELKTEEDVRTKVAGMPLFTDLCLAMRSDPLGVLSGMSEFAATVYGLPFFFAFPDPLVSAYRKITHLVSLVGVVEGTCMHWCSQEALLNLVSKDSLFGRIGEPKWVVMNFEADMRARLVKREGQVHLERDPRFWNLRPVESSGLFPLTLPEFPKVYEKVREGVNRFMNREGLPPIPSKYPLIRRLSAGQLDPVSVPRIGAAATRLARQKYYLRKWHELFVGYSAAVQLHGLKKMVGEQAQATKKRRACALPRIDEGETKKLLQKMGLPYVSANSKTLFTSGKIIVKEEPETVAERDWHATVNWMVPHGMEEVELRVDDRVIATAGKLYVPKAAPLKKSGSPKKASAKVQNFDSDASSTRDVVTPSICPPPVSIAPVLQNAMNLESEEEDMDVTEVEPVKRSAIAIDTELDRIAQYIEDEDDGEDPHPTVMFEPPTRVNPVPESLDSPQVQIDPSEEQVRAAARTKFLAGVCLADWSRIHKEFGDRLGATGILTDFRDDVWKRHVQSDPQLSIKVLDMGLLGEYVEEMATEAEDRECENSFRSNVGTVFKIKSTLEKESMETSRNRIRQGVDLGNLDEADNRIRSKIPRTTMSLIPEHSPIAMASPARRCHSDPYLQIPEIFSTPMAQSVSVRELNTEFRNQTLETEKHRLVSYAEQPPMIIAKWKTNMNRDNATLEQVVEQVSRGTDGQSRTLKDYHPENMRTKNGSCEGQQSEVERNPTLTSKRLRKLKQAPASDPVERLMRRNTSRFWWISLEKKTEFVKCLTRLDPEEKFDQMEMPEARALLDRKWREELNERFNEAWRTKEEIPFLIANPFVRTESQVVFLWILIGVCRAERTDLSARRPREEREIVMEALLEWVGDVNNGVRMRRRSDSLCMILWMMSKMSDDIVTTCASLIENNPLDDRLKIAALLLEIHASQPQKMEDRSEERMSEIRKIEEIKRCSNKELIDELEVFRGYSNEREFSSPDSDGTYQYVSGVMGVSYNPFVSIEVRDAYLDLELTVMLKFWKEHLEEINESKPSGRRSLGLILNSPEMNNDKGRVAKLARVKMVRTERDIDLEVIWKLARPSWCPHPNAEATRLSVDLSEIKVSRDEDMTVMQEFWELITRGMRDSPPGRVIERGTCLCQLVKLESHVCDGQSCIRILREWPKPATRWIEDLLETEKSSIEMLAKCYGETKFNIATALGFCSMIGTYESLNNLERGHDRTVAISVETWTGVLQLEQRKVKNWRSGLETEMAFDLSDGYDLTNKNYKTIIGSPYAPMCESSYPLHLVAVDAITQSTVIDQSFSVPNCVRLSRMSVSSYKLFLALMEAVPGRTEGELKRAVGKWIKKYRERNIGDFEDQMDRGASIKEEPIMDENDETHRRMLELEPLLEASGSRNLRTIRMTHDELPCHCLSQSWWYPSVSTLNLIWDVDEIVSLGLPHPEAGVTILVVNCMVPLRWMESYSEKYHGGESPVVEDLRNLDFGKNLDLFKTAVKILAIPVEVEKIWFRSQFKPWFRAVMTAMIYNEVKSHVVNQRVYREVQAEIGPEAFKRVLKTHRNAVTSGWKRVERPPRSETEDQIENIRDDLLKNVSLSLHLSFCRNRKASVAVLPHERKKLEEQRAWSEAHSQIELLGQTLASLDGDLYDDVETQE